MLLVGLLAVCAGINTLGNDFAYDDFAIIVNNPAVTQPDRASEIWMRDYWAAARGFDPDRDLLYRPLTVLSYRLNHAAGGLNPFGYHMVNVVLHTLVSMLLVVFSIRVSGGVAAGIIAGSVFAVMPIHTEAIANVVGRAELLVGLFTLIALLFVSRLEWRFQPLTYVGGGAAALAALLSKESGIAVIALVPLFACVLGGRFRWRHAGWTTTASGAALLIYLPLRYFALDGRLLQSTVPSKVSNVLVDATLAERFWSAWQLIGFYVAKTFWPRTLCMDYSYNALPPAHSPFQLAVIVGLLFVVALVAFTVRSWRRGEFAIAVTCLAILICYLPVSNTFFLVKTVFAERLWYLPSMFLSILIGVALVAVGKLRSGSSVFEWRGVTVSVAVTIAVIAGLVRGWIRNTEWRNNSTLFASAYAAHPDSAAVLYCYGDWLLAHDNPRGIELLERCVRIAPGVSDAQLALGRAYLHMGEPGRALTALQAAAMHIGDHPEVQALLDEAIRQNTEPRRQEIEYLRDAFASSRQWSAMAAWVDALTETGRINDALAALTEHGSAFADRTEFHRARAVNLMLAGRRDQAIEAYRKSLKLNPNQPDVQAELATALLDRRQDSDLIEAQNLIKQAVSSNPDSLKVMIVHAEVLAIAGKFKEATAAYQALIKRLPPGDLRDTMVTRLETMQRE